MSPRQPTAEQDFAAAQQAFAGGKPRQAVHHLACALATDPTQPEWLSLLNDVLRTVPEPLDLVPLGANTFYGTAAVHALVLAKRGQLNKALNVLLPTVLTKPDIPYLDWAIVWVKQPAASGKVDASLMSEFVQQMLERYPDLRDSRREAQATLQGLPALIEALRETQILDDKTLCLFALVLRKLRRHAEALGLAQEAYQLAPGYQTAVSLAQAHQAQGNLDHALQSYRAALRFDSKDCSVRLDIADLLWAQRRHDEAAELYREILKHDPNHPWALPSYWCVRFEREGDAQWERQLQNYASAHPDNERAQALARRVSPYRGYLPEPQESSLQGFRDLLRRVSHPSQIGNRFDMTVSVLEAPSAFLAIDLELKWRGWDVTYRVDVARIQKPDPRQPWDAVDHLLWQYQDTRPFPVVLEAPKPVTAAVAGLAARDYDLKAWSGRAEALGRRLGPSKVDAVLGVMVHPPRPPVAMPAWVWVQRVQVAAALVLAHLDTGWRTSLRKQVLCSLVRGPMDWTTGAAVVALANLAVRMPQAAADVAELFEELHDTMPREGFVCYHYPLVCCSLWLPGLHEEKRHRLEETRRRLEK